MARGNLAPKANRPPDGVSNLTPNLDTSASNQLKMTGPGPIKPQVLQARNLSKRVNNLKLPSNQSA